MSEQTPTHAQAVRTVIDARLGALRKVMPGKITAWNSVTQRASVQPLLPDGYLNERGERVVEDLPVVNEVPIMFQGSGGARERFPIHVGDTVLLLFADGSLDRWLHKGDGGDSGDDRRHTLTDAIAIPGLQHSPSDADVMIEFTESEILAGGSLALALQAELADLKSRIASWTPIANDGGSSLKAVFSAWPVPGTTVLKGG